MVNMNVKDYQSVNVGETIQCFLAVFVFNGLGLEKGVSR
jgi:hypothetical protein